MIISLVYLTFSSEVFLLRLPDVMVTDSAVCLHFRCEQTVEQALSLLDYTNILLALLCATLRLLIIIILDIKTDTID